MYQMFKPKKVSKEKKALILFTKRLYRQKVRETLPEGASDVDVDKKMDKLIEKMDESGFLQETLKKYLEEKIRRERQQSLGFSE